MRSCRHRVASVGVLCCGVYMDQVAQPLRTASTPGPSVERLPRRASTEAAIPNQIACETLILHGNIDLRRATAPLRPQRPVPEKLSVRGYRSMLKTMAV
jgi:hypothetical protein